MNTPQRPLIWLHRSRRFWMGLVVLLFLLACWLVFLDRGVAFDASRISGSFNGVNAVSFSVANGSLEVNYEDAGEPSPAPPFQYQWFLRKVPSSPVKWLPEFFRKRFDLGGGGWWVFSFPLWIPVVIWIPLWLLWMKRGDDRDAKRFGSGASQPASSR